MSYGYIYLVTDLRNCKKYVGQKKQGKFDPKYFGRGVYITRSVNKDKRENGCKVVNFKLKLLEWADSKEELHELERVWIKRMDCITPKGYNLTEGGEAGPGISKGTKIGPMHEKHKKNISNGMIKALSNQEVLDKWRKPKSEETKKNMRKAKTKEVINKGIATRNKNGWFKDPESVKKIYSIAIKESLNRPDVKAKMRKPKSEEHKKSMRKPKLEEHKKNISIGIIRHWLLRKQRKYDLLSKTLFK